MADVIRPGAVLLAQLEGLVEIARLGNVSRAAEVLYVTQPALTARVKALERELGQALLVRTPRGVRLSEAGRAFLPHAQRALTAVAEGRQLVEEVGRGTVGELRLGATPVVSTYVLPEALARFHEAHPQTRLSVRTGHSEDVLAMVLRDEVQLGLTRALRHADVETTALYDDDLVLVVAPTHPFAARGRIRIRDLGGEQLILFDRTSSFHELTSALFREAGVSPRGVIEMDNAEAAKKMVERGLGIALLPRTVVEREMASGNVRGVPIVDAAPVRRRIVAIRRRDGGPPSQLVGSFLQLIADVTRAPEAPATRGRRTRRARDRR